MGWVRQALKQLKAGRPVTVHPTGGSLRGRIEGGQAVTLSPVDPAGIVVDDVVLARWKDNPMLLLVTGVRDDQLAIGDTLGGVYGWVHRSAVLGKVTEIHELPEGFVPKPKPRRITFGLDTPNDYGPERVLNALGVSMLPVVEGASGEAAQVLFLPSFHPECCLTATLDRHRPRITLVTMQTNLWYWWGYQMQQARGNWNDQDEPPPPPERWEESAPIPAARLDRLDAELKAVDPLALADTNSLTIDGMGVQAGYRSPDGRTAGFVHRIHPNFPQHHAFVIALYGLGVELLHDERSVCMLEKLHGYLGLGLPLRLPPGPPLTIRIFGRLSSSDEQNLRRALAGVPSDQPLLVDMSNFDGMGTLLYPVFQEFLQRMGMTVWWARGYALKHLSEVGVPSARVFETREAAVAALVAGR